MVWALVGGVLFFGAVGFVGWRLFERWEASAVTSYRCAACQVNWPNERKKYGGSCPGCGLSTHVNPGEVSDNDALFEAYWAGREKRRLEAAERLEQIPKEGDWELPDPLVQEAEGA